MYLELNTDDVVEEALNTSFMFFAAFRTRDFNIDELKKSTVEIFLLLTALVTQAAHITFLPGVIYAFVLAALFSHRSGASRTT